MDAALNAALLPLLQELRESRQEVHALREETLALKEEVRHAREETLALKQEVHLAREQTETVKRESDEQNARVIKAFFRVLNDLAVLKAQADTLQKQTADSSAQTLGVFQDISRQSYEHHEAFCQSNQQMSESVASLGKMEEKVDTLVETQKTALTTLKILTESVQSIGLAEAESVQSIGLTEADFKEVAQGYGFDCGQFT